MPSGNLPAGNIDEVDMLHAAAQAGADEPLGWRSLFDTADLHLFSAKRGGRNRVRAPGCRGAGEGAP